MSVDPIRHLAVFSPHRFGDRRVDVIGCGATGSRMVLSLAKLGVKNIHCWDFDHVAEHNVANQIFGNGDIGAQKVDALKKIVYDATGTAITAHNERVDGSQELGEVVFLLTDTMSFRKEIWEKSLRLKIHTKLLIETRMGADLGRVYALNPNRLSHARAWEATLCSDEAAEVSACGAATSVGPTAEIISGLAVWQLIRWESINHGAEDDLENEILFGLRSTMFITRKFK